MLPRIRNRQADLLIMGQDVDGTLARIAELPSSSNRSRRRATSPRYASTTSRTSDAATSRRRGDFAAALGTLPHLAAMEMLLEEGDSDDPDLRRGLAMSLRRVGYSRGELGDRVAARRDLERSASLMKAVSDVLPDDIRRRWDVGWSRFYLGQFLLESDDEAVRAEGADHFVEASRLIVSVCVAEPEVATYRDDVGAPVPDPRHTAVRGSSRAGRRSAAVRAPRPPAGGGEPARQHRPGRSVSVLALAPGLTGTPRTAGFSVVFIHRWERIERSRDRPVLTP